MGVQIAPLPNLFRIQRSFPENTQASATDISCKISKFFRTATLKKNYELLQLSLIFKFG